MVMAAMEDDAYDRRIEEMTGLPDMTLEGIYGKFTTVLCTGLAQISDVA